MTQPEMSSEELKPLKHEELEARAQRKPYKKPHIFDYGDVRDTTMGASPGIGDSANPALLRP